MLVQTNFLFTATIIATVSCIVARSHAEERPSFAVRGLPQTVFPAAKVDVEIALKEPWDGATRFLWSLETLQRRTIARNEITPLAGRTAVTVAIEFPQVDDGVVLPLIFQAAVAGSPVGVQRKVWVFPRSPWVGNRKAVEQAKITLFDPAETTAKLLTEAEVPFDATANVAAITELQASTILIGEGLDLREYPDLASTLWKAAAVGNRVVCLSPSGGTFAFADEPAEVVPTSFSLRRRDVLTECDPRFDTELWNGDDSLPVHSFALRGDAVVPSLEVTDEAGAWPWLEVRFGTGSGKLIVCGFGLLDGWQATPTPRYLLAHLLTHEANSRQAPSLPPQPQER